MERPHAPDEEPPAGMILTVTPNPTVDRVFFVRHFRLGATIRGEREVAAPAGKGVAASMVMNEGTAICQREQVEELLPQVQVEVM